MKPGEAPQSSQQSESLVRRLAGASVNKAGLALDQTEINRIIAEASVGSKFYDNEKRKDKELTERIKKLLREKDDALREVDIHKVEAAVDQMVQKLEEQRDLSQFIVHVDMDAFFANVEILRDPSLKGKPFAVGGGVISTASYEARKYGVRSGMAGFIGKKLCPQLIYVGSHYDLYNEISGRIMGIFRRYDPTMCPAGCDEAYLNITAYCEEYMKPVEEVVSEMRQAVFVETQLTVSAGIAPNKMLAKICSDKNKPNGQFMLDFNAESIKAFMYDLSMRKVPGVGRVNERLLESVGIKTCGDIYKHRGLLSLMDKQFGLVFMLRTYLGIASNHVEPYAREERKSIGAERTFSTLDSEHRNPGKGSQAILDKLLEVAEELEHDMKREGWVGKTVTLKYKLDTYQVFTRAKSFPRWITTKDELFETGKELLLAELPLKLRLIGLRLTKLKDIKADAKPTGIKRFFEPVKQSTGDDAEGSPRKRRRLDRPSESNEETVDYVDEDHMPGFYEHEEYDTHHPGPNDHEKDEFEEEGVVILESNDQGHAKDLPHKDPNRPRPPVSAPASSQPTADQEKTRTRTRSNSSVQNEKRSDPADVPARPEEKKPQRLECPICGRKMRTDNQGLNSHIDFCLSRDAIWDAQTETIGAASTSNVKDNTKQEKRASSVPPASDSKPPGGKGSKKGGSSKASGNAKDHGMLRWVKKDTMKRK